MGNKSKRIIIDTNLWISFLITKNFAQLDEIILSGKSVLIFSEELLSEFLEVVARPKFKRFFKIKDVESLIEIIQDYAEFIDVKSVVNECRDEKDNFLLALAVDSEADYLLIGDGDLLEIQQFNSTQILRITEFIEIYK